MQENKQLQWGGGSVGNTGSGRRDGEFRGGRALLPAWEEIRQVYMGAVTLETGLKGRVWLASSARRVGLLGRGLVLTKPEVRRSQGERCA
jgi:hypothetical protein